MSFIINKETWNIKNQYITDENFFNSRRNILKKLAASSLVFSGLSTLPKDVFSQSNPYSSSKVNNLYKVNRAITKEMPKKQTCSILSTKASHTSNTRPIL